MRIPLVKWSLMRAWMVLFASMAAAPALASNTALVEFDAVWSYRKGTNALEEQAVLSAASWQVVTQFISVSNTARITLPFSTSTNSSFFRARSW